VLFDAKAEDQAQHGDVQAEDEHDRHEDHDLCDGEAQDVKAAREGAGPARLALGVGLPLALPQ
jgi:hypothetical protein